MSESRNKMEDKASLAERGCELSINCCPNLDRGQGYCQQYLVSSPLSALHSLQLIFILCIDRLLLADDTFDANVNLLLARSAGYLTPPDAVPTARQAICEAHYFYCTSPPCHGCSIFPCRDLCQFSVLAEGDPARSPLLLLHLSLQYLHVKNE